MATGINHNGVLSRILTGLFMALQNADEQRIGTRAAPTRRVEGLDETYHVPKDPFSFRSKKNGVDFMEPLSWGAPARPLEWDLEPKVMEIERYAESLTLDNKRRKQIEKQTGDVNKWTSQFLYNFHADRHNLKVCQALSTAGNYASGQVDSTLKIDDETASVWEAIEEACDNIRQVGQVGGADIVVAMGQGARRALKQHPDFWPRNSATRPYGNSALATLFKEEFGAELLVDGTIYRNGNNVSTKTMSDDVIAVYARGNMLEQPTFIHTPAAPESDVGPAGSAAAIADLYTDTTMNPRGEIHIAESCFKVEIVNPELGFLFSNVLT